MHQREFYTLAEELLQVRTAARNRSAISRAWLAAEHYGKKYLSHHFNFNVSQHRIHDALKATRHKALAQLGFRLSDLYSQRIAADYRLEDRKVERPLFASDCVNEAKKIIDELNDLRAFSPEDQAEIVQHLQNWQQSRR